MEHEKLVAYHLLAENPKWLKVVKAAIEEEKNYPKKIADIDARLRKESPKIQLPPIQKWPGFEWSQVHCLPATLNKMFDAGLLDIATKTNTTIEYKLANPEMIKGIIAKFDEATNIGPTNEKLTSSIFDPIVDYEDDKKQFVKAINRVLRGGKPTHFLLEGVPASGKSLFIDCIADTLGGEMYIATGANTTEAGLSEMLMRVYTVVAIDEIDFLEPKAMSVLLRFMESGDIVQTKHARIKDAIKANTMVIGACNSTKRIPPALVSRFYPYHLYFPPYTKEQFIEICENWLPAKEGVANNEIAKYIAERLYNDLGYNTDPRTARGLARQLEDGTKEEVDEQIAFLRKRAKRRT